MIAVWVEPHERWEAINAYRDWLTNDQTADIRSAPRGARIKLVFSKIYGNSVEIQPVGEAHANGSSAGANAD